jgi:hypothetical protein
MLMLLVVHSHVSIGWCGACVQLHVITIHQAAGAARCKPQPPFDCTDSAEKNICRKNLQQKNPAGCRGICTSLYCLHLVGICTRQVKLSAGVDACHVVYLCWLHSKRLVGNRGIMMHLQHVSELMQSTCLLLCILALGVMAVSINICTPFTACRIHALHSPEPWDTTHASCTRMSVHTLPHYVSCTSVRHLYPDLQLHARTRKTCTSQRSLEVRGAMLSSSSSQLLSYVGQFSPVVLQYEVSGIALFPLRLGYFMCFNVVVKIPKCALGTGSAPDGPYQRKAAHSLHHYESSPMVMSLVCWRDYHVHNDPTPTHCFS